MEAPFPAPGRTITVKNFLPGSGTEVSLVKYTFSAMCTALSVVVYRYTHVSFHLLYPCSVLVTGDRAVSAIRFPFGTCGL